MINRDWVHPCLRFRVWAAVFVGCAMLAVAVPLAAGLSVVAGALVYSLFILVAVVFALMCIAGVAIAIMGGVKAFGDSDIEFLALCGGLLGFFLCGAGSIFVTRGIESLGKPAFEYMYHTAFSLWQFQIEHNLYMMAWAPALILTLGAAGTGLSIAAMRTGTWLNRAVRKTGNTCPRCLEQQSGFTCPCCGEVDSDLRPSRHGLMYASCGICHRWLPTTDLLGRSNLQKICMNPGCKAASNEPGFSTMPEAIIALAGGSTIDQDAFAPTLAATTNHEWTRWQGRRGSHACTVIKTRSSVWAVPLKKRLYLHSLDCGTKDIGNLITKNDVHYIASTIVLFINPLIEPQIGKRTEEMGRTRTKQEAGTVSSGESALIQLVHHCERVFGRASGRRFPVRVTIVVTRPDIVLQSTNAEARAMHGNTHPGCGPLIREYLSEMGLGNMVGLAEQRFKEVRYFALNPTSNPRKQSTKEANQWTTLLRWLTRKR
jgi:hypothetical protein